MPGERVSKVANCLGAGPFSLAVFHHLDNENGENCRVNLQEKLQNICEQPDVEDVRIGY